MNISVENQSATNSSTRLQEIPVFSFVMFIGITAVVLPIGIVGNLLVIVVVQRKRVLRTNTNFLLANLAGSDLLASVLGYSVATARTFPMPAVAVGKILCKVNSYFPSASFCSILTLTVIALERYNGIVKPLRPGFKFGKRTLRYFCAGIWFLSFALASPLVYFDDYNSSHRCIRTWSTIVRAYFWTCASVICIGVPLSIILYCYVRIIRTLYFGLRIIPMNIPLEMEANEKKKVIKLSVVVTAVFILSFLPFSVVRGLDISGTLVPNEVNVFSLILVLLSSILNPFIYAFQSTNYRRAFRQAITCRL